MAFPFIYKEREWHNKTDHSSLFKYKNKNYGLIWIKNWPIEVSENIERTWELNNWQCKLNTLSSLISLTLYVYVYMCIYYVTCPDHRTGGQIMYIHIVYGGESISYIFNDQYIDLLGCLSPARIF